MTIEFSLRRRAALSRYRATAWAVFAVAVMLGTYLSLPRLAGSAVLSGNAHMQPSGIAVVAPTDGRAFYCAMAIVAFGMFAGSYAGVLLGRLAFIELDSASRCMGLADALCIAEGNMESLEKAVSLLVPKSRCGNGPEILSKKDRDSLIEILKLLRQNG